MAINHKLAVERIEELLKNLAEPRFEVVIVGQPMKVVQKRAVAFWYMGDEPSIAGDSTLGNAMVSEVFMVRAYWEVPAAPQLRENREVEMWDFIRNSKAALRGDSTLNGRVTDLKIGDAQTGFQTFDSGEAKRVAYYELRLTDLEAETIAA